MGRSASTVVSRVPVADGASWQRRHYGLDTGARIQALRALVGVVPGERDPCAHPRRVPHVVGMGREPVPFDTWTPVDPSSDDRMIGAGPERVQLRGSSSVVRAGDS